MHRNINITVDMVSQKHSYSEQRYKQFCQPHMIKTISNKS
jgi:hypothetical protein